MSSRVLRRRSATAAWIYAAVACGIVGTIVAARVLGLDDFGVFATALASVGFFQIAPRPHRRGVADEVRLPLRRGAGLGTPAAPLPPGAAAQDRRRRARDAASSSLSRRSPTSSSTPTGVEQALLAAALLPLVQSSENVGATALLLHSRYDLRGVYQAGSAALRLLAIVIAAPLGVTEALVAIVVAQAISTVVDLGRRRRRAPALPVGAGAGARRGRARRSARSSSSRASRPASSRCGRRSSRWSSASSPARRRSVSSASRRRRRPGSPRRARPPGSCS